MFLLAAHPGATRKFHEHVARMMDRLSEAQIGTRVARSPKYNRSDRMPSLDATFSALADPTRRAILARLALGEATGMELVQPFEMTQPAISRHLKVLEGAGPHVRPGEGSKGTARLAPAGQPGIASRGA